MDQRPWLKHYPAGIPANIDAEAYCSLIEFAEECFKKYKNLTAFSFMGKSISYHDLDVKSKNFAAYLHSRGLKPGDKIALMMPNLLQYPIAIFGALRAGLVIVNTNPLYTPHEMEYQFNDSGVKAIVIAENFAANLEKIIAKTKISIVIRTTIGEFLGGVKGWAVDFMVKNVKKMVPKFTIPNTVCMGHAIKEGSRFTIDQFTSSLDDVILLQYTGGTTGVSKGTMLTNRNMVGNLQQIRAILGPYLKEGQETTLSPLPMYHIFAFAVNVLAMMAIGANTVLIVNARDIGSVSKAFKDHKISLMTGVNTLYNALLNFPGFDKHDFSALRVSVGGAMAIQTSVADRWKAVTGCSLCEGFGMTETSPVVSLNPLDGSGKMGSIGLPVPSTDVRIVAEDGHICGPNEAGEIQVSGPQVMKGYYNKPEETALAIKDGWLCTGDIGVMDDDGYFKIVDRKKDMILVSGFNVYPNEIEDVIMRHPKVLEVAAIGMPDEKCGEMVKVFIVKKDQSLTASEIIQYTREYLTNYKIPKEVVFRDSLPKTNVGKILRRELRNV
ncbi:MAG: AMP-binding protein [Saprospiraceae bacterium]|nr:AMP-binding protein [Saprospiraceae bacterium]MBK7810615.1 AMP-binding protein [Saprospiraceae bacterium]MBK9630207.1 AMP-binding protein [Saprospiraceae bacterium]